MLFVNCNNLRSGICQLASDMAGKDCPTTPDKCTHCTKQVQPPQSINIVTVSIAVKYADNKKDVIDKYGAVVIDKEVVHKGKPGTELKNLISWFVWSKKVESCGRCKDREDRMNKWGPDKCEKNILTIIEWLRESAKERGYPFSERIAVALIKKAINNSRKK